MTQLFISVSLDAFEEVRHESCLLLHHLLLKPLIFLLLLLILRQFLKLLKFVCQVLEIGGPIVILATEMFLLHGTILGQFFGAVVLASGHFKTLA